MLNDPRSIGSPPRRRGKAERAAGRHRPAGITPAQAGKSEIRPVSFHVHRDHPRIGGEKVPSISYSVVRLGSPPRRRGKGRRRCRTGDGFGITPAWAGKSSPCKQARCLSWDHPRMGGEKPFLFYGGSSDSGSPPHGRGKDSFIVHCHACVGITPAWAGKSPELRGYDGKVVGSPPHGRGKGQLSVGHQIRERITPAWAGKRAARGESSSSYWDHPRIGGEKAPPSVDSIFGWGSPPRRRGKGMELPPPVARHGITPA